MRKNLLTVLNYFGYFLYAPSFEEIYVFFPKQIVKKDLAVFLNNEVKNKKILRLPNDRLFRVFQSSSNLHSATTSRFLYTLPQYSITRLQSSKNKISAAVQIYVWMLKLCPLIRFVGITGKSAMTGIRSDDDIDLCIVTKHGLLWTTRFFVIVLAKLLRIHSKTGVCLNLFFDEDYLSISHKKQNIYIAHELLQMKPLIDKNNIYYQFLIKNRWLCRYFPNVPFVISMKIEIQNEVSHIDPIDIIQIIDRLFKSVQLPIILRNHVAFSITPTQLWLFKNDFEKKLKRAGLVI